MRFVISFPEAEIHFLCESPQKAVFQETENLVARGIKAERNVHREQGAPDSPGLPYGRDADPFIEPIPEELVKLDSEDSPLFEEGAVLLYDRSHMRDQASFRDDDSLPEEGTALCPSDIEDIAELCDIRKTQIIFRAGQGIGEPCAVQIEGI